MASPATSNAPQKANGGFQRQAMVNEVSPVSRIRARLAPYSLTTNSASVRVWAANGPATGTASMGTARAAADNRERASRIIIGLRQWYWFNMRRCAG